MLHPKVSKSVPDLVEGFSVAVYAPIAEVVGEVANDVTTRVRQVYDIAEVTESARACSPTTQVSRYRTHVDFGC